ncbi:MAG: shikimate dehydrogenase [Firmicutes bacterium]|nr:shikimate dehydrogenase [Bacillota bacterium]
MNEGRITGETKLLAVIGHPVRHSLSPRIHNRLAAKLGLPYAYMAFDIEAGALGRFVEAARVLDMAGFNATMPHKEHILPYLDDIDEEARRYGAVNTVVQRDGRLLGFNTDGQGFLRSLPHAGFAEKGGALVLGAGGAAKAVALALCAAGWAVCVASRGPSDFVAADPRLSWAPWADAARAAEGRALLVNATPLGMRGREDFGGFLFLDTLSKDALVYDLLYDPRETALLREARRRGLGAMNGLPHLVHQAALSFALFTGRVPEDALVDLSLDTLCVP